jgi:hypothetical protein
MELKWVRDLDGDITLEHENGESLGWVIKYTDTNYHPHVRRGFAGLSEAEARISGSFSTARQAMRALRTRVIVLTIGGRYGP